MRVAGDAPPEVEDCSRDRRPWPARDGMGRLIAIALLPIRHPAERPEIGHAHGKWFSGPRHGGREEGALRDGGFSSPISPSWAGRSKYPGRKRNPGSDLSARGIAREAGSGPVTGVVDDVVHHIEPDRITETARRLRRRGAPFALFAKPPRPLRITATRPRTIAGGKTRIRIYAILVGHPGHSEQYRPGESLSSPNAGRPAETPCYPRFPRLSRLAGDFARSYIRPEPAPGAFASFEWRDIKKPGDRHSPSHPRLRIRYEFSWGAWGCGGLR